LPELLEEPEILPATKSPHGYFASQLSDNIFQRDDGSLIVVGCPIARTGFQQYSVKDLPQERAKELGVDVSNPSANIDLYRPASEVFAPEFLASLNGRAITDGHPPNGAFVEPANFSKHALGHLQNPRKGPDPLEDGEWPIIADLIISGEPLVSKVKNKTVREISLGYDFSIDRQGDKICQVGMIGNHCAIVPQGRAGDLIRIEDALPEEDQVSTEPIASPEISNVTYPPIALFRRNKEKRPVAEKATKSGWFQRLKGERLITMARAADADPEDIMAAAKEMNDTEVISPPNTQENEFKSEDKKKSKDGEVPEALKENQFEKATDARKRLHDALDAVLDRTDGQETGVPTGDKRKAKDADMEELRSLLDEFLEEEEAEPEHAAQDIEADPSELEATLAGEAEDCPDCGTAMDDGECPTCSAEAMDDESTPGEEEVESGEAVMDSDDPDEEYTAPVNDKKRAKDQARTRATDGAAAVLKMLRPVVARSTDKAIHSAFNRALDSVKRSSRVSTGSYGAFAGAARARDKAPRDPNPTRARAADAGSKADPVSKMQEFYNKAHGGK